MIQINIDTDTILKDISSYKICDELLIRRREFILLEYGYHHWIPSKNFYVLTNYDMVDDTVKCIKTNDDRYKLSFPTYDIAVIFAHQNATLIRDSRLVKLCWGGRD